MFCLILFMYAAQNLLLTVGPCVHPFVFIKLNGRLIAGQNVGIIHTFVNK